MSSPNDFVLDVHQTVEVGSAPGDAFRALLRRLSTDSAEPNGKPMPMVLEEWPGGRWFRDLDGGQGHLWGFVQVIKPPTLLEIQGPLFMSYAVAGHVQFRLTPIAGGVELSVRHRAFGQIDPEHREGVTHGWGAVLASVQQMVG